MCFCFDEYVYWALKYNKKYNNKITVLTRKGLIMVIIFFVNVAE